MENGIEKLVVWQKAMDLVEMIYSDLLHCLPDTEKYALNSQMRRAAVSIPANIAEGHGRYYFKEGVRFCLIARGLLEEIRTYLYLMSRLNYISSDQLSSVMIKINEIRKMLNGYINYLQEKSKKEPSKIMESRLDEYFINTLNSNSGEDDH